MDNLGDVRENYLKGHLTEGDLSKDPITQFEKWYNEAVEAGVKEPNGMTLSTSSPNGKPSARIVLLKGFGPEGFAFYTNYQSQKGQELALNPLAAVTFWWIEMERQVRIEGTVVKLDQEASTNYFQSRPRGSQISAWSSPQSKIVSMEDLNNIREEVESKFDNTDSLPLPDFWGGYIIKPSTIEFWQGRADRYHDRLKFQLDQNGHWVVNRLAP